jgi:hypothetical protein
MNNFCIKCGKKIESGASFCPSCGEKLENSSVVSKQEPILTPPPVKSGCGKGCLVGCLMSFFLVIFILVILIGIFYYYAFVREVKPGSYFDVDPNQPEAIECDSLSCLDNNLKSCIPSEGETELGEFATADIQILGTSGSSCVVYAKITKINQLPPELEDVPEFMIDKLFNNATLECLIPKTVYNEGMEELGNYIGENMHEVCDGPLFEMAEKLGIDFAK